MYRWSTTSFPFSRALDEGEGSTAVQCGRIALLPLAEKVR
jgi:hypothetical protein